MTLKVIPPVISHPGKHQRELTVRENHRRGLADQHFRAGPRSGADGPA